VIIKQMNLLIILSGVCGAMLILGGCSSNEPAKWTKTTSPWDRSDKNVEVEAPAAESYKADLEMPVEPAINTAASDVELSYQTEPVEASVELAVVPAAEPAPEATELQPSMAEEEPVPMQGSIMDQPADYYTMQLMASVDIDRVMIFAEQNQLSTQYVVATERDGVVWHVLLMDVYADYATAVAARDEIAPRLKNEPWIRRVGSVQKLIPR